MDVDFDGFSTSEQVWYDKNPMPVGPQTVDESCLANVRIHPTPAVQGSTVIIRWHRPERWLLRAK
ncbi:MAG: hypothetical protein IPJ85_05730 [Flavobacteriales bacterium]|nr:hypothetical protein [Flavobacteriales bacterium]